MNTSSNQLVPSPEIRQYIEQRFAVDVAHIDQTKTAWEKRQQQLQRANNYEQLKAHTSPSAEESRLDDYNSAISYITKLKNTLEDTDATQNIDVEILKIDINMLLRGKGLPNISSQLYTLYQGKPFYFPSKKHKGYFITSKYNGGKYEDENGPNVTYYKIEGDKMKYYNFEDK